MYPEPTAEEEEGEARQVEETDARTATGEARRQGAEAGKVSPAEISAMTEEIGTDAANRLEEISVRETEKAEMKEMSRVHRL